MLLTQSAGRRVAAVLLICGALMAYAPQVQAQTSNYLPLAVGTRWTLQSSAWNVTFEVTAIEDGAYRMKINNPWLPWEVLLFPVKDKVYLQSQRMGSENVSPGGYALYYDFTAPTGSEIPVSLGTLRVVSRNLSVVTGAKTYTNCIKLQLSSSGGFTQAWSFAPGVGLVEFEFAGTTFRLNEAASALGVVPPNGPTLDTPVSRGDRVLAINVNTSAANDYLSAFSLASSVGMHSTSLHFDWNAIETGPQLYQGSHLQIANLFYPSRGVGVNLTLAPIHNVANNLPDDLKGLPLDHPLVISRFKKLLDFVLAETPNLEINAIVIGSEIDGYMRSDAARWSQFTTFFAHAAAHIRASRAGVRVATEFTFNAFLGRSRPYLHTINQYSDVIGVSYYPMDLEGMVLDPSVVSTHFKVLANAFPQKPIHFTQFGFPSSALLQSSEARQSDFIRETFKAWDAHGHRVTLLNFTFLHDLDRRMVGGVCGYFDLKSASCQEFLATLGLRTFVGSDKAAVRVLDAERSLRGW